MSDFWSDMLQQQKDSVPAIWEDESRQALEALEQDYGIILRPMEPAELEHRDYQVLPADSLARLSGALQQVPGLVAGQSLQNVYQNTYANAYRLLIPKGSENLSFMKNSRLAGEFGEGAVDPTLVDSGGTIRRKAGVEKIDPPDVRAQQIAYLAFSAASLVTNQYFLQRIDKKLEGIQQTTTEILHFLELDKQCKLQGYLDYLVSCYANLDQVIQDDSLRQAYLFQIEEIKKDSMGNIRFYRGNAKHDAGLLNNGIRAYVFKMFHTQKDEDNLCALFQKASVSASFHWFAVYVYDLASLLELLLKSDIDNKYIKQVQFSMSEYAKNYIVENTLFEAALSSIQHLKGNTHLKTLAASTLSPILRFQQLRSISDSLETLNQLLNGPIELAVSGEKVYLKLPERQVPSDDGPDVELRMREKG